MPTWVHEWVIAPAAFGLALAHAARALGARRAAVELLALVAYGFALEWVAMAVFASHRYGASWSLAPAGVPLAIAMVWAAVITSAMAAAARFGAASPRQRAALAASFGIALDLMMEPVAARLGLWEWTPHGPWLDVPIGNFVGWAVIVGGYTLAAERWAETGALHVEAPRRVALAAGAIAALVAVGMLWTGAGAERLFEGAAGWIAWAALAVSPLALSRLPPPTEAPRREDTLAGRLAAAPGAAPIAVFAIVGLAFAIDALTLGGRELVVVVGGAAVGLAALKPRRGGRST